MKSNVYSAPAICETGTTMVETRKGRGENAGPLSLRADASDESIAAEAMAAFDHTCQHYLKLTGREFLNRLKSGEFEVTEQNRVGFERAKAMLEFAGC